MDTNSQSHALIDHMADWSATLTTRSGLVLDVRPASPDDEPLLADMFENVAKDDLRFRFLTGLNKVSAGQLTAMTHVDHNRTENFLAFDDSSGALVATADARCRLWEVRKDPYFTRFSVRTACSP